MMLAYQPVKTLTKVNVAIGQGLAAANRIIPIIDIKNEINFNENNKKLNIKEGTIIFDKINFVYKSNPENRVLQNVSLKFIGGKMTALVGHSGSGKSTLLNMIPRIYSPSNGKIELDGQDISTINLTSLRDQISIVDQNTTLLMTLFLITLNMQIQQLMMKTFMKQQNYQCVKILLITWNMALKL